MSDTSTTFTLFKKSPKKFWDLAASGKTVTVLQRAEGGPNIITLRCLDDDESFPSTRKINLDKEGASQTLSGGFNTVARQGHKRLLTRENSQTKVLMESSNYTPARRQPV